MVRTRDIDHTSDEIVLKYTGDGNRIVRDVPARDLTGADVARLAYVRDLRPIANGVGQPVDRDDPDSPVHERPDPRNPKASTIREVLDELEASDIYEALPAPKAAKKDPEPTVTTNQPDAPAPKPEA